MSILLTAEQKKQEVDKFLVWLRRNYPANGANIKLLYRNTTQLQAGIEAYVHQYGNQFKFEIALARKPFFVLRSIAHEYEHVRQIVNEKIPIHKINKAKELAAWGFAMMALSAYKKEVGDRCKIIFGE